MATLIKGGKAVKALVLLRLHLNKCYDCRGAIRGLSPKKMCDEGMILTVEAAKSFSAIASLHRKALDNPGNVIYACPDRKRHGAGYVETATPYVAQEIQDRLF